MVRSSPILPVLVLCFMVRLMHGGVSFSMMKIFFGLIERRMMIMSMEVDGQPVLTNTNMKVFQIIVFYHCRQSCYPNYLLSKSKVFRTTKASHVWLLLSSSFQSSAIHSLIVFFSPHN